MFIPSIPIGRRLICRMPTAIMSANSSVATVRADEGHPPAILGAKFEHPPRGGIHGPIGGGNSRLICRVAKGGSRRDLARLVARTQHRRVRHMKGLKLSKPWILKELEEEEETEDELQQVDRLDIGDDFFADKDKILDQWCLSVQPQGSIPSERPENNMSIDGNATTATEGNGATIELKEVHIGDEKS